MVSAMRTYPVWQVAHQGPYVSLLDTLLANRNLNIDELEVGAEGLHPPEQLLDLQRGVERIERSIRRDEHIVIFGDYDVDGVSSTALMLDFLDHVGASCDFLLPDRHHDGYGLKPPGVRRALELGARLIITVDNGISAFEALQVARAQSVDVVVIDHHRQNVELPPAHSIINPNRLDCDYPFKGLAGVGVTFKVVQRLSEAFLAGDQRRRYLNDLLDLFALGTVADIVPLLDENRILLRYGLRVADRSTRPGFQALRGVARVKGRLDTRAIGFYLGPRLNVAGRLEKPDLALELLRTDDSERARELAGQLDDLNARRRQMQKQGIQEALSLVGDEDLERERLICSLGEEWDLGVIGLIASALCETFSRPAVAVTDVKRDGTYVGSARSIPGYDVNDGIRACSEFLTTYGGHAAAAGFSLPGDRYEEFRAALIDNANANLSVKDLQASLHIDTELDVADIHYETVKSLARLEPFGQGNPVPVFVTRNLEVESFSRVGREAEHLKVVFRSESATRPAIWWRQGEVADALEAGSRVDAAYELSLDAYKGLETAQMVVKDLCLPGAGASASEGGPVTV
ncbi:MAG: single-stranded-DNA-specific exonuclease RecJ [Candidatus Latescibacterota bacterium]|nr:single-stranded-DNA-specific exonuclease RecJ [Candidatus Latescibacterota bacterium]